MTKQIEDELNLPRLEDALNAARQELSAVEENGNDEVAEMARALQNFDPSMLDDDEGVDEHRREMDNVIETALDAHKQILDLAFNVEVKHAGSIFMPAARMLELAVTASKSKADQKMKALKLRMEREKLDSDLQKNRLNGTVDAEPTEDGQPAAAEPTIIADRNDLMKQLRDQD